MRTKLEIANWRYGIVNLGGRDADNVIKTMLCAPVYTPSYAFLRYHQFTVEAYRAVMQP